MYLPSHRKLKFKLKRESYLIPAVTRDIKAESEILGYNCICIHVYLCVDISTDKCSTNGGKGHPVSARDLRGLADPRQPEAYGPHYTHLIHTHTHLSEPNMYMYMYIHVPEAHPPDTHIHTHEPDMYIHTYIYMHNTCQRHTDLCVRVCVCVRLRAIFLWIEYRI